MVTARRGGTGLKIWKEELSNDNEDVLCPIYKVFDRGK